MRIANASQFRVLRSLFQTQAASYFHLGHEGRKAVDTMAARGWMTRRSSLLSEPEASYVNFLLNKVEFSNGPELRNKYMHGSQPHGDEDLHFHSYVVALRLMIALVIKLNDDFVLAAPSEAAGSS
ncbi:MAG: hypothetical protein Q7L55_11825 [Actinomycetota bacterium]|nr:hypothetical protein [Actinomycetota bacterium]